MSIESRIEALEKAKALLKARRYSHLSRDEKITRLQKLLASLKERHPLCPNCPNCPNCTTSDKCQRLYQLTHKMA